MTKFFRLLALASLLATSLVGQIPDTAAPMLICKIGNFTDVQPTHFAQISASELVQSASDDATPANQLVFSLRRKGSGTGFPLDANGNPVTMLYYNCNAVFTNYHHVEVWVRDLSGKTASCDALLLVQDPDQGCDPASGWPMCVRTETDLPIQGVAMTFPTPPGVPPGAGASTSEFGCAYFPNSVPLGSQPTITPVKDDNPLNGVSTYDLLLIQKHILGIQKLDSPYKLIAADANKSNSITTFDILELRKLILGIYVGLPNTTSWRFVPKDFVFPNPANPFATQFPEEIKLSPPTNNSSFIGIKIGDVNNTAISN